MTPVSNAELVRRIDGLADRLEALFDRVEETYLRRDVAAVQNQLVDSRIAAQNTAISELTDRIDRNENAARANRRLAWSSLAAPILTAVIAALLLSVLLP